MGESEQRAPPANQNYLVMSSPGESSCKYWGDPGILYGRVGYQHLGIRLNWAFLSQSPEFESDERGVVLPP